VSSNKSEKKWGGARPGAGRKRAEVPNIREDVSLYLTDEQWIALREEAAQEGDGRLASYINEALRKKANSIIKKKNKGAPE